MRALDENGKDDKRRRDGFIPFQCDTMDAETSVMLNMQQWYVVEQ